MRSKLKINLSKWDEFVNFIRISALNIALIVVVIAVFIILGTINYLYLRFP